MFVRTRATRKQTTEHRTTAETRWRSIAPPESFWLSSDCSVLGIPKSEAGGPGVHNTSMRMIPQEGLSRKENAASRNKRVLLQRTEDVRMAIPCVGRGGNFGLPGSGFGAAQTGIAASPSRLFIDSQFFALGFGEQQYCQNHDDIC